MKIWKYIKFCLWGYWRIPKGDYCYKMLEVIYPEQTNLPPRIRVKRCPYWESKENQPHQDNGYCHWIGEGDHDHEGLGLLWDQIKECGLNEYSEKEEEKMYAECMKGRENEHN